MRFATVAAILVAALTGGSAMAMDTSATAVANRQKAADLLARELVERLSGRPLPAAEVRATIADLNLDAFAEVFAEVSGTDCGRLGCGLHLFVLEGDEYFEVLTELPEARQAKDYGVFNRKRNGYLDLQFDDINAGWTGELYADLDTFPYSNIDIAGYVATCEKWDRDYLFIDGAGDRATLCQCEAETYADFALSQELVDELIAQREALELEKEPPPDSGELTSQADAVSDATQGCLADLGLSQWYSALYEPDYSSVSEERPQQPLEFAGFFGICSRLDWLVSEKRIGTPDRALATCHCMADWIAASGADQAALDGLTRFYLDEIDEEELDAIDASVLNAGDKSASFCLQRLPQRR
mgnify:CR=1 FL=1